MHSEAQLITRAQQGDRTAFDCLRQRYAEKVYYVAARMLRSPEDARDASQETFINAFRFLHSFHDNAPFGPWLYRIASRVCLSYQRRLATPIMPLDEVAELATGDNADPCQILLRQESTFRLLANLLSLSSRDRRAIMLKYWHNLDHQHVAELLGTTPQVSRVCLLRAKKRLAALQAGSN